MMKNILFTVLLLATSITSQSYAAAAGPYEADAYTLHLYHFDGNAGDADAVNPLNLTLAYGATVTETSYTDFGTALNTYEGSSSNTSNWPAAYADEQLISSLTGSGGEFTFEAIICPAVQISAIPNNMQIICGDDESDGGYRGWQFRVSTDGQLVFIYLTGSTVTYSTSIPATGDHAWAVDQWVHVAVTYTGQENTADNLKFYWTRLDSGESQAVLLASFQMAADLVSTASIDLSVGNDARDVSGENFEGMVDEARISSIAREPNDMLFLDGPAPAVIITQPADTTVRESQDAVMEAVFTSESTPSVKWFKSGIPDDIELSDSDPNITIDVLYDSNTLQYTTTLTLGNTLLADASGYYCRILNESGIWRTSQTATLSIEGLIARWTLDVADFVSGRYRDIVGSQDANVIGTPAFVTGADGTAGGAVLITPSGGRAVVESFNPASTGQLTLSLWVNWQETSVSSDDLRALESLYNYLLNVEDGLKADNNWQQICIVLDDSTGKLYVNGKSEAEGSWSLPQDLTSLLNIGAKNGGEEIFNGAMDDIRIYNYAMTDKEVADIYYAMTHTEVCILDYAWQYDFTGSQTQPDCVVDLYDLLVFANQWLTQYDLPEFMELSQNWLSTGLYPNNP